MVNERILGIVFMVMILTVLNFLVKIFSLQDITLVALAIIMGKQLANEVTKRRTD